MLRDWMILAMVCLSVFTSIAIPVIVTSHLNAMHSGSQRGWVEYTLKSVEQVQKEVDSLRATIAEQRKNADEQGER